MELVTDKFVLYIVNKHQWNTFMMCSFFNSLFTVTGNSGDQGFPRGWGRQPPRGGQHMILPNFSKTCMKLKEFGPPEGCASLAPLRSANG